MLVSGYQPRPGPRPPVPSGGSAVRRPGVETVLSADQIVAVSAPALMRSVVVTIKLAHVRSLRVRVWLGKKLFKLAAKVIGCTIIIE